MAFALTSPRRTRARAKSRRARVDPRCIASPSFTSWFAGSQAVDSNGLPLVLYHGTISAFDRFDPARVCARHVDWELGPAFYFSSSPSSASAYALSLWSSDDEKTPANGACVMPCFLNFQRPLIEDVEGQPAFDWIPDLISQAKEKGHDGVIAIDVDDGVIDTQYVAFSPDQIRSIYSFPFSSTTRNSRP